MAVTKDHVLAGLQYVRALDGSPLLLSGRLSEVIVTDGRILFSINIEAGAEAQWEPVRRAAESAVCALGGVKSVMVALTAERPPSIAAASPSPQEAPPVAAHRHQTQSEGLGVPGVNAIIAVASGKGGVGKSTTAVNLALGLSDSGMKVGLLDADIYGPSVPRLLGVRERPETVDGKRLKPIMSYGLTLMSIGFLIEEETPMIWRGPMVMSALTQMLREVEWGSLDLMMVDMPPGTGDAQLTMAQQVPLAGAIIVSTPQDLALIDARRGIAMFKRVDVPVLGIVENMSFFLCPHCGGRAEIFGHGGARHEATRVGVPFLGEVPLAPNIRETSDTGRPVVASAPDGPYATIYRDIAGRVRDELRGRQSERRSAPKIIAETP
jgi:ATP-binding protein involved in chromosome partitioning